VASLIPWSHYRRGKFPCTECWVGPRMCVDATKKTISAPTENRTPVILLVTSSSYQPKQSSSHYWRMCKLLFKDLEVILLSLLGSVIIGYGLTIPKCFEGPRFESQPTPSNLRTTDSFFNNHSNTILSINLCN